MGWRSFLVKIYLDVCCLNRPFDDLSQERIRLESEAVLTILGRLKTLTLLRSEIVDFEISKIPDQDRKQKVMLLSSISKVNIVIDDEIKIRARELNGIGFKPLDAFHIACAEKGKADVLLTTDDHLLKKAMSQTELIRVRLENPLRWLIEELMK
jgi:predicted nucleic acid-binding protein